MILQRISYSLSTILALLNVSARVPDAAGIFLVFLHGLSQNLGKNGRIPEAGGFFSKKRAIWRNCVGKNRPSWPHASYAVAGGPLLE